MDNKCVFCHDQHNELYFLSSAWTCKYCIELSHDLIIYNNIKPKDDIDKATLSLIFLLELDLRTTKRIMQEVNNMGNINSIVSDKMKMIQGLESYSLKGVDKKIQSRLESSIIAHENYLFSLL